MSMYTWNISAHSLWFGVVTWRQWCGMLEHDSKIPLLNPSWNLSWHWKLSGIESFMKENYKVWSVQWHACLALIPDLKLGRQIGLFSWLIKSHPSERTWIGAPIPKGPYRRSKHWSRSFSYSESCLRTKVLSVIWPARCKTLMLSSESLVFPLFSVPSRLSFIWNFGPNSSGSSRHPSYQWLKGIPSWDLLASPVSLEV